MKKHITKDFILKCLVTILSLPFMMNLTSCNFNASLIISEVMDGTESNRAIELYNNKNQSVDLSNYNLEIYFSDQAYFCEKLDGELPAKSTYVIVSKRADEELKAKANLLSDFGLEDLLYSGKQPIILRNNIDNKIVDIVGIEGIYNQEICVDMTLIRKEEYLEARKVFNEYDWIRLDEDEQNYLGTIEAPVTEKELLEGPRIAEEYLSMPFSIEKDGTYYGGGGLMDVTVKSYVDGDTTWFDFSDKEEMTKLGFDNSVQKCRYQNIDTPESYEGNVQEFGMTAKEYTNEQLKKASVIRIQTTLNGTVKETFDRLLGWVWIDDELLNFKIVKKGYSDVEFGETDIMKYKGVSYTSYLYNAMLYAQQKHLGRYGEKDPYWDYKNGTVKDGVVGNPR